ncbi:hypothetical protein CHU98_g12532, partial [Xylaria longipes]
MSTPTPNPAVFHQFSRMPSELCDMVWDIALLVEAYNRMVLVDVETRAIYPTRLLASPFLRVCYASRERAKRTYSHQETVRKAEEHRGILELAQSGVGVRSPLDVGTVYLSPQYDTFCTGPRWDKDSVCNVHWNQQQQRWVAGDEPYNLSLDIQVIADRGWEGQILLMDLLSFKYRLARLKRAPINTQPS